MKLNVQWTDFKIWLEQRMRQPMPGIESQMRMVIHDGRTEERFHIPPTARHSGVLMLLYPNPEEIANLVLIQRSNDGGVHSGQIALPGGKKEQYDPSLIATALREANEEINLKQEQVQVLGQLTHLYIPVSNFMVQPVLAIAEERPVMRASDAEVAQILEFSLWDIFCNSSDIKVHPSGRPTELMKAHGYCLPNEKFVWGATAMMLSELENLWIEFWRQFA